MGDSYISLEEDLGLIFFYIVVKVGDIDSVCKFLEEDVDLCLKDKVGRILYIFVKDKEICNIFC